jgi:hypothetical protein
MTSPVTRKLRLVTASVALVALAGPCAAWAAEGPPVSAVSQYVEQVPTSDGSAAVAKERPRRSILPPAARKALASEPSKTSAALTEIATSSRYGAPPTPIRQEPEPTPPRQKQKPKPQKPTPKPRRSAVVVLDPPSERSSLSTAFTTTAEAVGAGSDARLLGLVGFLSLTTVAMAAVAVRERRSSRISVSK